MKTLNESSPSRVEIIEKVVPEAPAAQINAAAAQSRWRSAKRLLQIVASFVWWIGALFLSAGRLDWVRGWICVALWVVAMTAVGLTAQHYNAPLLEARARWRRKDTKRFDKIFLAVYLPLVLIQPVLAGLDAARFHWSSMPFGFVYIGSILFALAMMLIGWVMCINPFAESSARIQTDRGQTVITSGPYRLVRHPMYVGAILMYLGTPLIWGSVWALALGGVMMVLLIWRTGREDRMLRQELPGYDAYAASIHYRLLPGLW